MPASQGYFLINDLKKGIFSCFGVVSITFSEKLIFIKEEETIQNRVVTLLKVGNIHEFAPFLDTNS
jgi:hypothetical protein